jgi:hypothetical protein
LGHSLLIMELDALKYLAIGILEVVDHLTLRLIEVLQIVDLCHQHLPFLSEVYVFIL